MSQSAVAAANFSILDVVRGMGHRKLLLSTCLATGLLAGIGIVTLIKPTYHAEARVLIDNLATPYDQPNVAQAQTRDTLIDKRIITSQVAVLQSEDLAMRVISNLGLSTKPEFDSMKKGLGMVSQLLIASGFRDDPRLMTPEQRAFEKMSDALTIYEIPESNVIGIKFSAGSGELASEVANALADSYVIGTREANAGDNSRARQWLSSQIDELRIKVATSDAAVEKFRTDSGLLKGQTTTLGTQELSELNTQITLAEAARSEAEAKADEIRNLLETRGSVEASSEVLNSATIQRLREQQVTAQRRVSELSATYLSNHPRMVAATRDVADIEKQIRREALKIVDGLQGQAKIATARAASLRKSLEGMKLREGDSAQDDVRLRELEREAKANRDQLEAMLARFADSNTRQNLELQPGYARVIQRASAPATPTFPRIGPTVLLTTLAGLGLGLGLAFLLEIMAQASRMTAFELGGGRPQPQPRNSHAALQSAGPPPDVPQLDLPPRKPAAPQFVPPAAAHGEMPAAPFDRINEQLASLPMVLASMPQARTAIEARALLAAFAEGGALKDTMSKLGQHFLSMVGKGQFKAGAVAGVGGSLEVPTFALALAREFASLGLKTILVDLEGQRCLLPDMMELPHAPGLTDLLSGASDFSKAIQRDPSSQLQYLRHGSLEKTADAQLPVRMEAITNTLKGIYDVVLLHMGEATPHMLQQAKGCDAVILQSPAQRKRDAAAAAATLRGKGFASVFLVQVEGLHQVAA